MREYPVTGVTEITATSYDGTIRTISIAALRIIDGGMAIQIPYDIFDKGNANITVTCTAGYLAGFHDQQLSTLKMATLRWLQVIWQDRELAIGRGANISVGGESVSLLSDAVPKDILSLIYRYERW